MVRVVVLSMKTLIDPTKALSKGLAEIRAQFKTPTGFSPEVLAAAEKAAKRVPDSHVDRTAIPFVTLDPAASTDLDQAFYIETSGQDFLLHYAIADVAWFVADGDALDKEAWQRGSTLYMPDGKISLYPEILSQGAASLLPDVVRPAVIFTVRVAPDGSVRLDGAERAIVKSRAKLAYENVRPQDLPRRFDEFAQRIFAAEDRRGASRVDPPEQEVEADGKGRYVLAFRPKLASENQNSAMSLAANLAIADAMAAHQTGLFRVMDIADDAEVKALRNAAKALGLDWPTATGLKDFQRRLDPADPKQASLMLAIRRAGPGASYMPYKAGKKPWHAAVAAAYAHATAPLRRLADRYVVRATLAIANGEPVPDVVTQAFGRLPKVMARADGRANQISSAVIELAEALVLSGREGEVFAAIATDFTDRGLRFQLCDLPVVAVLKQDNSASKLMPGGSLNAKLVSADPEARTVAFEQAG
jgi:exoribonuclease R